MSDTTTENMRQYFDADGSPRRLDGGTTVAHCAVASSSARATLERCKTCGKQFPPLSPGLPADLRMELLRVDMCCECLTDALRGRSMKPRHIKKRMKARAKLSAKLAAHSSPNTQGVARAAQNKTDE